MVKIIETNILMNNGSISDHQSRVIEAKSWEQYVDEIKNSVRVHRKDIIGVMDGCNFPKYCRIENLVVSDFRLQYDLYNTFFEKEHKSKKLAYLVNENQIK